MTPSVDIPRHDAPAVPATEGSPCAEHDPAAPCCPPAECQGEAEKLDGGGQPCPTPQHWQQVLASFREKATGWTVEWSGRRVSGRTIGAGRPLVFVNGIGGTHELFVLTAWLLRDEYQCVLFDFPDGKASVQTSVDAPAKLPPAMSAFAGDLLAVVEQRGLEDAAVYGAGLGAAVVLAALSRSPNQFARAVLQGGFARLRLSWAERLAIRLGRWMPGRVGQIPLRRMLQEQSHRPWFPPFDATRYQFLVDDTGAVPIRALARRAAALPGLDLRPALPSIRTPTLLIRTEGEGRIAAAAQDELQASLPNATSEHLFGCGQLPFLTHPHRLAKLLRPFLGSPS